MLAISCSPFFPYRTTCTYRIREGRFNGTQEAGVANVSQNGPEKFLSNMTYVRRTQILTSCVFDADHEVFDKFILLVHDR